MADFSDDLMMVLISHGCSNFEEWRDEYKKIEQFDGDANLHKKARVIYTLIAAMRKICRFDSPPFVGGLDLISRGYIVQPCRVDFYEVTTFNRMARFTANFEERMFYVSSHGTKDHDGWLETYTRVNESEDSLEAPLEFTPIAIGRSCSEEVWAASNAEMAIRKRIYCTTIDVAFVLQDGFWSEQVREARIRMSCKDVQGSVNASVNASSERGGATSPSADEAGGGGDASTGGDGDSNTRRRTNGSSSNARVSPQNMVQIETDFVASIRTNEGIRGPVDPANIPPPTATVGGNDSGTAGVAGLAATGESSHSGILCQKCLQCEECTNEACRARQLAASTGTFPRNKLDDVNRTVMNFAVNPVIQPHIQSGLITPPFTPYYGDLYNIIRTYENWPQVDAAGSSSNSSTDNSSGSADATVTSASGSGGSAG